MPICINVPVRPHTLQVQRAAHEAAQKEASQKSLQEALQTFVRQRATLCHLIVQAGLPAPPDLDPNDDAMAVQSKTLALEALVVRMQVAPVAHPSALPHWSLLFALTSACVDDCRMQPPRQPANRRRLSRRLR